MPLIVDNLLQKKEIDAIVTLGAVIQGKTKHDELIASVTAKALSDLSIKYGKPVTLGITGPSMTSQEAKARIIPVTNRAIESVIKMKEQLGKLK